MEKTALTWTDDVSDPLFGIWRFVDPAANVIEIGTGRFAAGQKMPETGNSQHPLREISIILEGEIETKSGGKTERLRAGDIVTIPPHQIQNSRFVADTKLVYIFFGHRLCREDVDS
jgi:quercetin dioxygenase-like cupin family protein